MSLISALSIATSAMSVNQQALAIVSRNVANAGTPGYHRQSLNIGERLSAGSPSAATLSVNRTFNQVLQNSYVREVADASYAATRSSLLDTLQSFFGKPGAAGSLDTRFGDFRNALQALTVSPDDGATRSAVVGRAQELVATLNGLSSGVQDLRQQAETSIASAVTTLNSRLGELTRVNQALRDVSQDEVARNALFDQRDRLVGQVAEQIDVTVNYRGDGSVSLLTRSGLTVLDEKAASFAFDSAGKISAVSLADGGSGTTGVGVLELVSLARRSDLSQAGLLQAGSLAALIELRDRTLVEAQAQLDDIAGALAKAFSTITSQGTAATAGAATGFDVDLAGLQPGDELLLNVTSGGSEQAIRVVRVDDASKLPMDEVGPDGVRVLGVSFAGGMAAAATAIGTALGSGFSVSNPAGSTLRIVDDGGADTTDVNGLTARTTSAASQGAGLGINLFVDGGNAPYTGSLDGRGQLLGFSSRIRVNPTVASNPQLLVKATAGGALGDSARPDYLLSQLEGMTFVGKPVAGTSGAFRLNGTVEDFVGQTIDYQGNVVAGAVGSAEDRTRSLAAIEQRMSGEYGVNVDDEMARLLELQTAYAANARILTVVQDLMETLMNA